MTIIVFWNFFNAMIKHPIEKIFPEGCGNLFNIIMWFHKAKMKWFEKHNYLDVLAYTSNRPDLNASM